jgi:hypothetical protein
MTTVGVDIVAVVVVVVVVRKGFVYERTAAAAAIFPGKGPRGSLTLNSEAADRVLFIHTDVGVC